LKRGKPNVGFAPEWENVYKGGAQLSVWPWSDLVSYVMRYARPERGGRVLELGFGAGANIPFFASLGVSYFGIEGSATAVAQVRKRHAGAPELHLACCDFTASIPFDRPFDLIVDRSSLTHNNEVAIRDCLRRLQLFLRPRAKFIGIDWFSTANPAFAAGVESGDYYTRCGYSSGQFKDVGAVHFSDKGHLIRMLTEAGFEVERLEHKQSDVLIPEGQDRMAWWNFVAVKP
jgi:hypothetical protein